METACYTENADGIEKEISENLSRIWDFTDDSKSRDWTNSINQILAITAKQNNRKYLSASKLWTCENSEWLYDFVWYDDNEFGLNNVYLVAESEWKNCKGSKEYFSEIKYDFEKLILARSHNKLMIFEGDDRNETSCYISDLKNIVLNCELTQKGDRYMFAVWNKETQEFDFDLLIATGNITDMNRQYLVSALPQ